MNKYLKSNFDGYVKDDKGVVFNNNKEELKTYREQILKSKKIESLESKVDSLTKLVEQLLEKK